MTNYLWVFILGGIAFISTCVFLLTITKSTMLVKKLKKKKINLLLDFILLLSTIANVGLIIYVFYLVKEQIAAFS